MPTCSKCGEEKPDAAFYFLKPKGRLMRRCKSCVAEEVKCWRQKNPEKIKNIQHRWIKNNPLRASKIQFSYLLRCRGLTMPEFVKMRESQGGLCGICREDKPLCIDHCHKTEKVRGLLCKQCNSAVGLLQESFSNLIRAADYIRRSDKYVSCR